jgi:hypothetical protein
MQPYGESAKESCHEAGDAFKSYPAEASLLRRTNTVEIDFEDVAAAKFRGPHGASRDFTVSMLEGSTVLVEEVKAIRGVDRISSAVDGRTLYRVLNEQDFSALCLSGGGIRSAVFSLGIVQALATTTSPSANTAPEPKDSLLAQFDYLSTVSGGGYLGGFLSAWLAREHAANPANGWRAVWEKLTNRRDSPDKEAIELSWLRAYSNYLTPRIGLASADSWAAIAIYVRNLLLNWLVMIPAIYIALLALKLLAILVVWLSTFDPRDLKAPIVCLAVALLIYCLALRFTCLGRPTHRTTPGGQLAFIVRDLLPGVLAAVLSTFALAFPATEDFLSDLTYQDPPNISLAALAIFCVAGATLYLVGWIAAWPPYRGLKDISLDLLSWTFSGAIFGLLMFVGILLYLYIPPLGFGYFTPKTILLLATGVPWTVGAKLIAEMVFVGLTSEEEGSDSDREWLGRAGGWYLVSALCWFATIALVFVGSAVLQDGTILAEHKYQLFTSGGVAGLVTALLGKSHLTPAKGKAKTRTGISFNIILMIAVPIFVAILIIGLSSISDNLIFGKALTATRLFDTKVSTDSLPGWPGGILLPVVLAGVLVVFLVSSWRVNINRFSLHAVYRNRLIRAFLGSSQPQRDADFNRFSGFNEYDNLPVYSLWPEQVVKIVGPDRKSVV